MADDWLHPDFGPKLELLQDILQKQYGLTTKIGEGYRSPERQNQLYAQGRTARGPVVTHAMAGLSYHNYGAAVDLTPVGMDPDKAGPIIGAAIKANPDLGLTWGGNFTNLYDPLHVQLGVPLKDVRVVPMGEGPNARMTPTPPSVGGLPGGGAPNPLMDPSNLSMLRVASLLQQPSGPTPAQQVLANPWGKGANPLSMYQQPQEQINPLQVALAMRGMPGSQLGELPDPLRLIGIKGLQGGGVLQPGEIGVGGEAGTETMLSPSGASIIGASGPELLMGPGMVLPDAQSYMREHKPVGYVGPAVPDDEGRFHVHGELTDNRKHEVHQHHDGSYHVWKKGYEPPFGTPPYIPPTTSEDPATRAAATLARGARPGGGRREGAFTYLTQHPGALLPGLPEPQTTPEGAPAPPEAYAPRAFNLAAMMLAPGVRLTPEGALGTAGARGRLNWGEPVPSSFPGSERETHRFHHATSERSPHIWTIGDFSRGPHPSEEPFVAVPPGAGNPTRSFRTLDEARAYMEAHHEAQYPSAPETLPSPPPEPPARPQTKEGMERLMALGPHEVPPRPPEEPSWAVPGSWRPSAAPTSGVTYKPLGEKGDLAAHYGDLRLAEITDYGKDPGDWPMHVENRYGVEPTQTHLGGDIRHFGTLDEAKEHVDNLAASHVMNRIEEALRVPPLSGQEAFARWSPEKKEEIGRLSESLRKEDKPEAPSSAIDWRRPTDPDPAYANFLHGRTPSGDLIGTIAHYPGETPLYRSIGSGELGNLPIHHHDTLEEAQAHIAAAHRDMLANQAATQAERWMAKPSIPQVPPSVSRWMDKIGAAFPDAGRDMSLGNLWDKHLPHIEPEEFKKAMFPLDVQGVRHTLNGLGNYFDWSARWGLGNSMSRDFNYNTRMAHNGYFEVGSGDQGEDLGKNLYRSQIEMYKRMGMKGVDMLANISVGGYAWAKYGFTPEGSYHIDRMRRIARDRMDEVAHQLSIEDLDRTHALISQLGVGDPKLVWDISDLSNPVKSSLVARVPERLRVEPDKIKLGQHLLLNTNWGAKLMFDDAAAMARFDAYTKPRGK